MRCSDVDGNHLERCFITVWQQWCLSRWLISMIASVLFTSLHDLLGLFPPAWPVGTSLYLTFDFEHSQDVLRLCPSGQSSGILSEDVAAV